MNISFMSLVITAEINSYRFHVRMHTKTFGPIMKANNHNASLK